MKDFFSRSAQTTILFLLVIGVLALALSGSLSFVSQNFNSLLVDAQSWVSSRFLAVREFLTLPRDAAALQQENVRLSAEVSRLQTEVLNLQRQAGEADALAALVNFSRTRVNTSFTAASVIGRDPSPFLHYIIIDRGSSQGILRGMPVVTEKGLVGRVDAVISDAARVQLITDPSSAVNVRLQNADYDAVLVGTVAGDLSLDFLPPSVTVEPGDVLLTSGLGGGFPADLIVGQVLNVRKRDTDLFQQATIQPVVDFSQLKIVLVVTDFRSVDISPLIPNP